MMSRPRLRPRVLGAIVAVLLSSLLTGCGLLGGGAYDLPLPGGPDAGPDPVTVKVRFASVQGLVPRSRVKVGNATVGEVTDLDVDPQDWSAVATVAVRNDLALPSNVEARVRQSSLLGEWYVELRRPAVPAPTPLASGAVVPVSATGATAPVEQVLGALSLLLNNGALPQLNTVIKELNTALDGREPDVKALLRELTTLTGSLDANRGAIVRAIDGLAALSSTLDDNQQRIATALDQLPSGVAVLADQREQLVAMLSSLDRLSDVATRVIDASQDDLVADLRLLEPTLTQLQRAGEDIPQALQVLATFPFTPGAMDALRGDYLNLEAQVELDLPTILSTLTGGRLFGTPSGPNLTSALTDPSTILGGQIPTAPKPSGAATPTPAPASGGGNLLGNLLGGILGGRS